MAEAWSDSLAESRRHRQGRQDHVVVGVVVLPGRVPQPPQEGLDVKAHTRGDRVKLRLRSRRIREHQTVPAGRKAALMSRPTGFVARSVVTGLLILVPLYLAVLLLLKGMKSVAGLVRPVSALVPDWIPAETLLSLLLVLGICFLVGAAVQTASGKAARERLEKAFFERIPGYALLRSLTQQMAGESRENVWKPALIVTDDDALAPAFIIEEHEDGRYTVFVPSIPTPLAGAVFVLDRARVRPLDVPFTEALRVVSRWGSGAKGLVAAMEKTASPSD